MMSPVIANMNSDITFSKPPVPENDTLLIAIFIALIVHSIVIIGINFTEPKPLKTNKTISVTIANMPSQEPPKKAKHLAQENQKAAGRETTQSKTPAQTLPSQGTTGKTIKPVSSPARAENKPKPLKKAITQKQSETKINTATTPPLEATPRPKPKLNPNMLARQVAQLGAQVRYQKPSSELSRIKFINSVSTHKYLAAQYMEDWRRKVEKTGNMNYPEIARQKHFTGKLTMDVGIRHDGSIYSIRVSKSSGYQLLDDAAKRIVRMSAPFAPLPKALQKELDVLVITRVWEFSDESGLSAY